MKVVGYGICGPGEAGRYMRKTLDQFKTLCDEVIILCNNVGPAEKALCYEYGFKMVQDNREWGKLQWKIKQDFLEQHVSKIARKGDMMLCLDMDEVIGPPISKEWLMTAPMDAYYVFVVDLWNDPQHYKYESCFWNVRIWRWNGDTKFKQKPVHCGLAPQWAYHYHRHAPFYLLHYGLMKKEDRDRKIARYDKYDPQAIHLVRKYYDMLKSDTAIPFDEAKMQAEVSKEVASYKQSKPTSMNQQKKQKRFAYVRRLKDGVVVDVPEDHLPQTLKQGFEFVGWADDAQKELEDMFSDVDVPQEGTPAKKNEFLPPTSGIEKQFKAMESRDEEMFETPSDFQESTNSTVGENPVEKVSETPKSKAKRTTKKK